LKTSVAVAAAAELFEVEEPVFFQAMHGFDVALKGVSGGRDAHVLAVRRERRENRP